jgi:hypothetical protein
MLRAGVGGLPVVDDNRVLGMLVTRTLARSPESLSSARRGITAGGARRTVRDLAGLAGVVRAGPTLAEVASLLLNKVACWGEGRPTGRFSTRGDIVRKLTGPDHGRTSHTTIIKPDAFGAGASHHRPRKSVPLKAARMLTSPPSRRVPPHRERGFFGELWSS